RVQTSGVGSMPVAPVMIRNEPDATSTDSTTTINPTARKACWPRWLNRREALSDGTGTDASGKPPLASAVSLMSQTVSRNAAREIKLTQSGGPFKTIVAEM